MMFLGKPHGRRGNVKIDGLRRATESRSQLCDKGFHKLFYELKCITRHCPHRVVAWVKKTFFEGGGMSGNRRDSSNYWVPLLRPCHSGTTDSPSQLRI